MSEDFQLTAQKQKLQVFLNFTGSSITGHAEIPSSIFVKVNSKVESWRQDGSAYHTKVYDSEIKEFWQALREVAQKLKPSAKFKALIGEGSPKLPGVQISPSNHSEDAAVLSISAGSKEVKGWYSGFLRIAIESFVSENQKKQDLPCPASIYSAFLDARSGRKVKDRSIPILPKRKPDKPFVLDFNSDERHIIAYIHHRSYIRNMTKRLEFKQAIEDQINELGDSISLKFLENTFNQELIRALHDREGIGVGLPLAILVAKGGSRGARASEEHLLDYEGKGILKLAISEDKMSASIAQFTTSHYKNFPNLNTAWLKKELRNNGILRTDKETLARVATLLERKSDINGFTVALGTEGEPPSNPILVPILNDQVPEEGVMHQAVDTVEVGDEIAKIEFQDQGTPSITVFGDKIRPKAPSVPVKLEGAEEKDNNIFVATINGLPEVNSKDFSVTVLKSYIHKGNVDLASGNIDFDGNISITGNIELGASVTCTGTLKVKGSIHGRTIKAKDIECKGGILLAEGGLLECNNLKANFVENSRLKIKQDLILGEGLLNSNSVVGGDIKITKKGGRLAGGETYCWGTIKLAKLGYSNNNPTAIYLGADFISAFRIMHHTTRKLLITDYNEKVNSEIEELSSRKQAQMGKKQKERLTELRHKKVKLKRILKKATEMVLDAKMDINYNEDSAIFVKESLATSCQIFVKEEQVYIASEFAFVKFTFKKVAGHHISAIEESGKKSSKKDPQAS